MDKISSILPNNNRVRAVDMDDSHPIRPGTPAFGRTVGTTANGREQMRNHLAEQKLAEQAQDNVNISEHGKQAANADLTNRALSEESEAPTRGQVPMKAFVEEVSGEPSFEQVVARPTAREAAPKEALPKASFFLERPMDGASNHSLDKYA